MKNENIYRNGLHLLLIIIVGSFVIYKAPHEKSDVERYHFGILERVEDTMRRILVYEKPISLNPGEKSLMDQTIIYVLSGNQESLMQRFKKASGLYREGKSGKILILSRPGITEYSPGVGRNLTNDEWSMRELERMNVRKEDIEAISIETGIFGTISEAKSLPGIVEGKGFRKLVLVTCSFHTKRAYSAFSKFAGYSNLELFIYGSEDRAGLGTLVPEYFKFILYENILLPAQKTFRKTVTNDHRAIQSWSYFIATGNIEREPLGNRKN